MAIKINNNTVIDDSQNITNITDITASGTVNGGIIATTAEAQAGSSDSVIMTPLKVKEAIQGGTISVIKSVQRFTLTTPGDGSTPNGYIGNWSQLSSWPSGATLTNVTNANYIFVNLPTPVSLGKSFLTVSTGGSNEVNTYNGYNATVSIMARLYGPSGYSGSSVQVVANEIIQTTNIFEIHVEVVEFY